jgi:hypothetical protein
MDMWVLNINLWLGGLKDVNFFLHRLYLCQKLIFFISNLLFIFNYFTCIIRFCNFYGVFAFFYCFSNSLAFITWWFHNVIVAYWCCHFYNRGVLEIYADIFAPSCCFGDALTLKILYCCLLVLRGFFDGRLQGI